MIRMPNVKNMSMMRMMRMMEKIKKYGHEQQVDNNANEKMNMTNIMKS